jgi:hypothetical protein
MKNKFLLTVKYSLASIMLGVAGLVGYSWANPATVSAETNVTLSLSITDVVYNLTVVSPTTGSSVGDNFSLVLTGENIDTVYAYIDLNGNNMYDFTDLVGTFTIQQSGTFGPSTYGPISLPVGTPDGTYNMKIVGYRYNGGDAETSSIISINYASTAPQIDQILPDFGTTAGGDNLTINGKNFDPATKVFIGDNQCLNIVVVSSSQITCTTPAGVAGRVPVRVDGPNGTYTDTYGFLYVDYGDSSGGSGGVSLPRVPNTGLFRVGDSVVMSNDIIIVALLVLVIVMSIALAKKDKSQTKPSPRASTKTSSRAKLNRSSRPRK